MYIWQAQDWPHFVYQKSIIAPKLDTIVALQKALIGNATKLPEALDRQAEMDALIQNAIQTSEIEGEKLNVSSVRSSVARHLGLEQAGLPAGTRQTESLVKMLCAVTDNLGEPVDLALLCEWQAALFPDVPLLHDIAVGELRGEAPMQVVSQKGNREIVHYQAPPRSELQYELELFFEWFNSQLKQKSSTFNNGIIRAAITHLWFITLHPFDDGNGRVARALTDRALAQAEQTSVRFYSLSAAIEMNRTAYYEILQDTQSCCCFYQKKSDKATDITDWINWFLEVLAEAIKQGSFRIERVMAKTRFWQTHSQTVLIARQIKVLNRLLESAGDEFLQGINARKYQSLAKVSKATATRDLVDLLEKGCLKKLPGSGRSTRYYIKNIKESNLLW
ncbi:MAG: Fic family protein [Thiohalomonadales bacterium]